MCLCGGRTSFPFTVCPVPNLDEAGCEKKIVLQFYLFAPQDLNSSETLDNVPNDSVISVLFPLSKSICKVRQERGLNEQSIRSGFILYGPTRPTLHSLVV